VRDVLASNRAAGAGTHADRRGLARHPRRKADEAAIQAERLMRERLLMRCRVCFLPWTRPAAGVLEPAGRLTGLSTEELKGTR
jgi:hypothetical protein